MIPAKTYSVLHRYSAAGKELTAHDLGEKTVGAVTLPTGPITMTMKFAVGGGAGDKPRDNVEKFASLTCIWGGGKIR